MWRSEDTNERKLKIAAAAAIVGGRNENLTGRQRQLLDAATEYLCDVFEVPAAEEAAA